MDLQRLTIDQQLEIDVLAGIMRRDEKRYTWLDELKEDDFTEYQNQQLLKFLKENKELSCDDLLFKISVTPIMRDYNFSDLEYHIDDQLYLSRTGEDSISQLRLNSKYRKIVKAVSKINKNCPTNKELESLMEFITTTDTNVEGAHQTVPEAVISVSRDFINKDGRPKQATLSGWKGFDSLVGGFRKGVYIIGGLPGTGKTTLTLQLLIEYALNNPKELVVLHSLEMALEDLRFKVASYLTGVSSERLEAFTISKYEQKQFHDNCSGLPENMILSFSGNLTAKEMELKNKGYVEEYGLDIGLTAIDYIQIASPNNKKDMDETKRIQSIAHELRALALTSYPIIALTQFTKDVEKGQKPLMKHIKGSGQIAQDAICVVMLYSQNFAEVTVSIEKNRFGMAGVEKDFDFLLTKSRMQCDLDKIENEEFNNYYETDQEGAKQ